MILQQKRSRRSALGIAGACETGDLRHILHENVIPINAYAGILRLGVSRPPRCAEENIVSFPLLVWQSRVYVGILLSENGAAIIGASKGASIRIENLNLIST